MNGLDHSDIDLQRMVRWGSSQWQQEVKLTFHKGKVKGWMNLRPHLPTALSQEHQEEIKGNGWRWGWMYNKSKIHKIPLILTCFLSKSKRIVNTEISLWTSWAKYYRWSLQFGYKVVFVARLLYWIALCRCQWCVHSLYFRLGLKAKSSWICSLIFSKHVQ